MVDFRTVRGTVDFIFMRHGESEANRDGVMQGRLPSRLTDTGREQARETGRVLSKRPPDAVLASPLTRARETAEIIAEAAGTRGVVLCDELMETDTGIFTGLTREQIQARLPKEWAGFMRGGWETVPGAEKIAGLTARAHAAWARLIALAADGKKNILCVSHTGFLQWIIRSTMGLEAWMPLIDVSRHCGVSLLHVDNKELEDGGRSHYASWKAVNLPAASVFPAD
jgi:broad specificity phosphatase PhoE